MVSIEGSELPSSLPPSTALWADPGQILMVHSCMEQSGRGLPLPVNWWAVAALHWLVPNPASGQVPRATLYSHSLDLWPTEQNVPCTHRPNKGKGKGGPGAWLLGSQHPCALLRCSHRKKKNPNAKLHGRIPLFLDWDQLQRKTLSSSIPISFLLFQTLPPPLHPPPLSPSLELPSKY